MRFNFFYLFLMMMNCTLFYSCQEVYASKRVLPTEELEDKRPAKKMCSKKNKVGKIKEKSAHDNPETVKKLSSLHVEQSIPKNVCIEDIEANVKDKDIVDTDHLSQIKTTSSRPAQIKNALPMTYVQYTDIRTDDDDDNYDIFFGEIRYSSLFLPNSDHFPQLSKVLDAFLKSRQSDKK